MTMKNFAIRVSASVSGLFGYATFASAAATDGIIGTLDFTSLTANVASVVQQAFPVAALAAGIALGLSFLVWLITHVRGAIRTRGN